MAKLQDAWRTVTNGQPHIVILSGEAGIGKTRLAEEMEAWVSRQGMTSAIAHCYAAEGRLAYAPVATWLRTDTLQKSLLALDTIWLTSCATRTRNTDQTAQNSSSYRHDRRVAATTLL